MENKSKILLAVDGSEESLNAVRHIAQVFSKQQQIVLFHVMSDVPEAFKDLMGEEFIDTRRLPLEEWREEQETFMTAFMEKARELLIDAGFEPEAIEVKSQNAKTGIARDIHDESFRGYAALAVGRTGVSNIENISMGSVASKLAEVTVHIPIIIVGAHANSNKILLALDGSKGSMRAVKFVGKVVDSANCELMLCHVVRPLSIHHLSTKARFVSKHEKEWIDVSQRKIVPVFIEAKKQLMLAGVSEENLSSEILTDESSRAAAIVKAAGRGGYDTIAMGRRGFSSVEAFPSGRVCRKILHFAFRPALWIVN
ncbi:MAG: universal stress protein [Desulfobacterales bacterium]